MENDQFTRIVFIEDEIGANVEIEGYAVTIQAAIHQIIKGAAQMTNKSTEQYISELLVAEFIEHLHDCESCDQEECEGKHLDCFENKEKQSGFNFEDILKMEFDLGDGNE